MYVAIAVSMASAVSTTVTEWYNTSIDFRSLEASDGWADWQGLGVCLIILAVARSRTIHMDKRTKKPFCWRFCQWSGQPFLSSGFAGSTRTRRTVAPAMVTSTVIDADGRCLFCNAKSLEHTTLDYNCEKFIMEFTVADCRFTIKIAGIHWFWVFRRWAEGLETVANNGPGGCRKTIATPPQCMIGSKAWWKKTSTDYSEVRSKMCKATKLVRDDKVLSCDVYY